MARKGEVQALGFPHYLKQHGLQMPQMQMLISRRLINGSFQGPLVCKRPRLHWLTGLGVVLTHTQNSFEKMLKPKTS